MWPTNLSENFLCPRLFWDKIAHNFKMPMAYATLNPP